MKTVSTSTNLSQHIHDWMVAHPMETMPILMLVLMGFIYLIDRI